MWALMARIQGTIGRAEAEETLAPYARALAETCERVAATTMAVVSVAMTGDLEKFLANSTPYLHLLGHTVIAWLWFE